MIDDKSRRFIEDAMAAMDTAQAHIRGYPYQRHTVLEMLDEALDQNPLDWDPLLQRIDEEEGR